MDFIERKRMSFIIPILHKGKSNVRRNEIHKKFFFSCQTTKKREGGGVKPAELLRKVGAL